MKQSTREGDSANSPELLQIEMQPDVEKQQNHADFSKLSGDLLIGRKPWSRRADDDPGDEKTDDRRDADPMADIPCLLYTSDAADE